MYTSPCERAHSTETRINNPPRARKYGGVSRAGRRGILAISAREDKSTARSTATFQFSVLNNSLQVCRKLKYSVKVRLELHELGNDSDER